MLATKTKTRPEPCPSHATLDQVEISELGKRPWESTKSGYLKWANVGLLVKARVQEGESDELTNLINRMDQFR